MKNAWLGAVLEATGASSSIKGMSDDLGGDPEGDRAVAELPGDGRDVDEDGRTDRGEGS